MSFIVHLIDLEHPQVDFCIYVLVTNIIESGFDAFHAGFAHRYTFNLVRRILEPYLGAISNCLLRYGVRIISTIQLLRIAHGAWDFGQTSLQFSERESSKRRSCIHPFVQIALTCSIASSSFSLAISSYSRLEAVHRRAPVIFAGIYIAATILSAIRPRLGAIFGDKVREWVSLAVRRIILSPYQKSNSNQRLALSRSFLDSKSQLSDYAYSPLKTRNMIRLLKLGPHEGSHSRITCDIIAVDFEEAPPYEAVSYRWGSSERSHYIRIGAVPESRLGITRSVYDVLRALTPLKTTRYLWIDSICINQCDNLEKDQQIPLMRIIYERADHVIAFLGDSKNAAMANFFLQRLAFYSLMSNLKTSISESYSSTSSSPLRLPFTDIKGWQALKDLMNSEYWGRVWIIQECVAARSITIIYGGESISWYLLSLCSNPSFYWQFKQQDVPVAAESRMRPGEPSPILCHSVLYLRENFALGNNLWQLDKLILYCRMSEATEPKDKVNALLGISSEAKNPLLRPNFQRDARDVYTQVVVSSLATGSFSVFSIAGQCYPRTVPELPSWVPDLSKPTIYDTTQYHSRYSTGTGRALNYEFLDDGYRLKIQGVLFDKISVCSSDPDKFTSFLSPHSEEAMHSFYRRLVGNFGQVLELVDSHIPSDYPGGLRRKEALWRTIIEDFDGDNHPADANVEYAFNEMAIALKDFVGSLDGNFPEILELDVQDAMSQFEDIMKGPLRIRETQSLFFYSHKFALIDNGYFALVPDGTEEGDVVAIFFGSPVPHVLRPTGNEGCYSLFGEAYVHGIMHGETLERREMWFTLL